MWRLKSGQAHTSVPWYAYYGFPVVFCLAIHLRALKTWFTNDDFAWLGLPLMLQSPHDLLTLLFSPRAEGTVRVISERLYFLILTLLFGLNAVPFRVVTFLTQFASVFLLMWITRRLTGSALAAFTAALVWCSAAAIAVPMLWAAAYNEICFAFFVLLSFFFLLRWIDTGLRRYLIAQWTVFLLGFGALELMVTYPALATAYTMICARKRVRPTLLLFIPAVIFTVVHVFLIRVPREGAYAMHFGPNLFGTLGEYWTIAMGIAAGHKHLGQECLLVALSISLLGFALWRFRERDLRGLFFLAWFLIVLAPVLPLRDHFTDYYLTVPVIGLAMLGAWAFATAIASAYRPLAAIACVLLLGYFYMSINKIQATEKWNYERARSMKHLMQALQARQNEVRGKTVLLDGVSNDLFWAGFADGPFRLLYIRGAYLTPGSASQIHAEPGWADPAKYEMSIPDAYRALKSGRAIVYSVSGRFQNITPAYLAAISKDVTQPGVDSLDVGDPSLADQLGNGWYELSEGYRWMSQRASLKLNGPRRPNERLTIDGFAPAQVLSAGPLELTVQVDGENVGHAEIEKPDGFELSFPLPPDLVGRPSVTVEIALSRVIHAPPDPRDLGLVFGTFTIR